MFTCPKASMSRKRTCSACGGGSHRSRGAILAERCVGTGRSERLADAADEPRQQGGARHDAGQVEPLVDRVVVAADRAQAVEGRQPERRGGVRVRCAAGGGVPQLEAQLGGDGDGERRPAARRPRSSPSAGGRRCGAARPSRRRRSVRRRAARPRPTAASNASAVAARRSTLHLASLGHHVGPRAAVDDAGVDGHRRPAAIEGVERQHLVRGLEDCGAALLRLDAGVRRAADELEVVVGDALARADDVAVGAGALEHQRGVVLRRQASGCRAC